MRTCDALIVWAKRLPAGPLRRKMLASFARQVRISKTLEADCSFEAINEQLTRHENAAGLSICQQKAITYLFRLEGLTFHLKSSEHGTSAIHNDFRFK